METVYDWVTVAIFAGLIVLFLNRAIDGDKDEPILPYLGAGAGCGLANYLGNEGYPIPAVLVILGVLYYTYRYIKPFPSQHRSD